MAKDPNNQSRELAREWKRLIVFAQQVGHGNLTIKLRDGKPVLAEQVLQQVRLDYKEENLSTEGGVGNIDTPQ